jgi:glycosyltransferase involved in cell wall biosynthesis
MRKRLAIVEFTMSAGGVERVLQGLATALLEIPEARDWDVTLLLSRYNSAHRRVEWPAALTGPRLRVEWLGEENPVSRAIDPLAHAQGVLGLGFTRIPGYVAARTLWKLGPAWLRAALGDRRALISSASGRFDAMLFTYPFWLEAPPLHCAVLSSPSDFNFKHFLPERSLRRRLHEKALRGWLARSDRLLVYGEAMAAEVRRFYPEHVGKTVPVPLGVTTGRPAPTAEALEALRRERGLPGRFALVTGWITPHKNPLVVVEALAELRRRGIDLPVVFVGPNATELATAAPPGFNAAYVERVRSAIRNGGLSVGKDVLPLGYVSDAELEGLFHLATAYVFPTRYEGFGLPSLEATLAGCPAVVSSIPPLLEQDRALGGAYRTFDPDDASGLADHLAWVLDHEAEARAAARAAAVRVAEQYDWRRTARAYLAHAGQVLSGEPLPEERAPLTGR